MPKEKLPLRVIVKNPLLAAEMKVQVGRDDLLLPVESSAERLVFEFDAEVDLSEHVPNFLGKFVHGPKNARFIYVNSGLYAGTGDVALGRRAKLSLMSIERGDIETVLKSKSKVLEFSFPGVARDGGPTCASVKGVEWKVKKR